MKSVGKKKPFAESCSSLVFVMFIMCSFLLLFSYTDNLSNIKNSLQIQERFLIHEVSDFTVQQYTWKCQNGKCVKFLADDNEQVSLNSCNMLCSQPPIWPKPTKLMIDNKDTTIVDKSNIFFNFSTQGQVKVMMQNLTDLFMQSLEYLKPGNQSLPGVKLNVITIIRDSTVDKLRLNTNESYKLAIRKADFVTATISAETYFGARHAVETLSQLIWYDEIIDELKILHDVDVVDSPKFPHRGVMVDTARNYFPISKIKKVVDGMAMSKLNVLHLHLTDAVSFPIVLPSVPQLASFGAYSSEMIYTPEDIMELIQYSLTRGVRVLLEVDAPGHVNAGWNFDNTQKFVICGDDDVFNGHLNPDNDETLTVLTNIYGDLLNLMANDEMFHIGSDEVNLTCWRDTNAVKSTKTQASLKRFWASYTNQMLERLKIANDNNYPENIIMWSSPLTESPELDTLDVNVVIQHWLGDPKSILTKGHKVIYSTVGFWYLDCGFGPWRPSMKNGVCDPYTSWHKFYSHRPWEKYGHRELVLGGEVCLWAEEVEVDTLETRIWPRAAAFAERVWSDPDKMDNYDVYTRLMSFSDRLKSKRIQIAAIWPRWCSQNPGKC